jgi:hypothetical protein
MNHARSICLNDPATGTAVRVVATCSNDPAGGCLVPAIAMLERIHRVPRDNPRSIERSNKRPDPAPSKKNRPRTEGSTGVSHLRKPHAWQGCRLSRNLHPGNRLGCATRHPCGERAATITLDLPILLGERSSGPLHASNALSSSLVRRYGLIYRVPRLACPAVPSSYDKSNLKF